MKTSLKTPTAAFAGTRPGAMPTARGAMSTAFASACAGRRGFTLVELIVVITVIVIVLALAVPGLTAMNNDAREKAAQQTINGLLTRAYYAAVANNTMTAVRFLPAEWDASDKEQQEEIRGRQRMTVYSFTPTSDVENNGTFTVQFEEYFKRAKDIESETLPRDMWVAPLEALTEKHLTPISANDFPSNNSNFGRDVVLYGEPYGGDNTLFQRDARNYYMASNRRFTSADDFLIVFDPQSGLRTGTPQPWWLNAPEPKGTDSPLAGTEHAGWRSNGLVDLNQVGNPYMRYGFSGLVLYGRENLVEAYKADNAQGMQNYLQANGRPLMIQRYGGGLVRGLPDLNQAGS